MIQLAPPSRLLRVVGHPAHEAYRQAREPLRATTDPDKLAQKTYANVFELAGEPVPTF
jgi:hypothetical protein